MGLEIGLLRDLLDALDRVGQYVVTAARLSKKRRSELVEVLSDTYEVLDRVLLMVIGLITRVIDRAERDARDDFATELSKLGYYEEVLEGTREMSLSSGLRRVHAELRRAPTQFLSRRAVKDWDGLTEIMKQTMHAEGGLSEQIASMLLDLSNQAEQARSSDQGFHSAWAELKAARETLMNERRRLIKAETKIYSVL